MQEIKEKILKKIAGPKDSIYEKVKHKINLQKANLKGYQLQAIQLENAQLQGAKLKGAQLKGAQLQGAQLQGAKLKGAQLKGAQLQKAQLQGAQLQHTQLQGANLNSVTLQKAKLRFTDLRSAQLKQDVFINNDKVAVEYAFIDDRRPPEMLRCFLDKGGIVVHEDNTFSHKSHRKIAKNQLVEKLEERQREELLFKEQSISQEEVNRQREKEEELQRAEPWKLLKEEEWKLIDLVIRELNGDFELIKEQPYFLADEYLKILNDKKNQAFFPNSPPMDSEEA